MRRLLQRAARFTALGLLTLVLLEVVLQLGHVGCWLFWRPQNAAATPGDAQRTILCVGDAFTFGMGIPSRSLSYPAQMEQQIRRQTGENWVVANGGWPGRNSRQVLEELDSWLERTRPEVVCVLVGVNDAWSPPDELQLPPWQAHAGSADRCELRWVWRTGRLLSFFRIALDRLSDSGLEKFNRGDLAGAEEVFRRRLDTAAADSMEKLRLHKQLIAVYVPRDQYEKVAEELAAMGKACRRDPSQDKVIMWIEALMSGGRVEDARQQARGLIDRYPDSEFSWAAYAVTSFFAGDQAAAEQAIARALTTGRGSERAWVWDKQARILAKSDRRAAMASAIRAFLMSGGQKRSRTLYSREGVSPDDFERLLTELVPDPAKRTTLRELWYSPRPGEIFRSHLRQILAHCRAAGARPLLASYPFHFDHETVARKVATEAGAGWIDVRLTFEEHLDRNPGAELFVPAGHCNEAGYRLLAEAATREVLREPAGR